MKIGTVSTFAISEAMRHQMTRMQGELVKANSELVTGKVADTGLTLGGRTGQSVAFDRDVERLKGLKVSNAIVDSRLSTTREALTGLDKLNATLTTTLTTSQTNVLARDVIKQDAQTTLSAMNAIANTRLNGEYIFAGANTDMRPMDDILDPASPTRQELARMFDATFGFALDDPRAAEITASEMGAFLTEVETLFTGPGWNGFVSAASDQPIQSRIAFNETTHTSVSANEPGFRQTAMAATTLFVLLDTAISDEAAGVVTEHALAASGQATAGFTALRTELGMMENRVAAATKRVTAQIDLLTRNQTDMIGVDPYEAQVRVTSLMAQIETSYTLTARMQQLSLLRFIT